MKKHITLFLFLVILAMSSVSCKQVEPMVTPPIEIKATFTVTPDSVSFPVSGGIEALKVTMNGAKWEVVSNEVWCSVSSNSSSKASTQITVTAASNTTTSTRRAKLTFVMDNKTAVHVNISQATEVDLYPSYKDSIPADATGMSSTATELAKKIKVGLNIGNTLEATGGETGWGNPLITNDLIKAIKLNGFNAIRLPVAWNQYADQTTSKTSALWLNRVKQVVQYCVDNNMYVIINIHWDGGWLENNPTYAKQVSVNAKQKALWEQIAVYFRGYDEHLLFAGTNEVHVDYNAPSTENITVQQSYNQTFVDAVRSTGGKNAYRNLIIQSYNTNIGHAVSYLKVPTDKISNRLMVEVHYYDPWEFAGDEKSSIYLWGASNSSLGSISSWGQESYVQEQFGKMKTNFVDKGYPVILGEYGAIRRSALTGTALTNHLAARAYYFQYVTEQAKKNGLVPFYWDNGYTSNFGFALFNRTNATVFDQKAIDALISGANAGVYPF